MARKDITFGEPFHRTKQTLLLFCSAIILTRIPGIDVTGSSGILGVSLQNVNIDHVRWGLLGGAAYYYLGFLLEAVGERHSNTGTSRFGVSDTLGEEVTNVAKLLSERASSMGHFDSQLRQAGGSLQLAALGFTQNLDGIRGLAQSSENGGRTFVSEQILDGYVTGAETLPAKHEEAVNEIGEAISHMKRSAEKVEEIVGELRKDIRGLARDIRWWKRIQFYGWDIAGATFMFVAAIVLSPSPW